MKDKLKIFTKEFINSEFCFDVELNKLKIDSFRVETYNNGGILSIAVDFNKHNRIILSKFIKDFKLYDELLKYTYSCEYNGQVDIISIVDMINDTPFGQIHYDKEKGDFYYS